MSFEENSYLDLSDIHVNSNSHGNNSILDIVNINKSPKTILSLRSYNNWSLEKHGATLVWRDLCVYASKGDVPNIQNLQRIINNSTGAIQPGSLMALMGSSGAGKSTLMSSLAFRQPSGTVVQGDILINGRRIGPFMQRISGFVHQDDLFLGYLTVREHLMFMANLRLDRRLSQHVKHEIIMDLLERTGLKTSANSRIGHGDDAKVISGGERKRLAFASELITNPTILFCDEPTTGLDSYSAQQLIQTLSDLAKKGTTVMCTIHQPSSQLFAMFDQVLLLAEGRIAFTGTPNQALKFFAQEGYICPDNYNPADFLIGVLSSDPGHERASQRIAHRICDLFTVSNFAKHRDTIVNLEFHMAETLDVSFDTEILDFRKPFWAVTIFWLIYRETLSSVRDSKVQLLRFIQKIAIAILMGLCFAGTTNLTQPGVQAIQGVLFTMVSENTFNPMYSVLSIFPQGLPLFLREKRSGLYSTVQYYISHIITMLPGLVVEPFVFVLICYWLAGLKPTLNAFLITSAMIILVMNTATACGCFFSTAFNSVPLAMAYLVPVDYIFMITSGIFLKLSSIPSIFSWMPYISWMMYANEAMSIIQWDDTKNITCYEESANLPCMHTGDEVLEKYSFSTDHLYRNVIAMFSLYLIFHCLALFSLWKRARRV